MPTREEELREERLAKLNRMRSRGIDPYPPRYARTHTAAEATVSFEAFEAAPGKAEDATTPTISVGGRLSSKRDMGRAAFLDLEDSTGTIQVFVRQNNLDEASVELLKDLDLGDIVGATGP